MSPEWSECLVWTSNEKRSARNRMLYYFLLLLITINTEEISRVSLILKIQNTIKEGKIIRELLRGAGNVGGKQDSILQW